MTSVLTTDHTDEVVVVSQSGQPIGLVPVESPVGAAAVGVSDNAAWTITVGDATLEVLSGTITVRAGSRILMTASIPMQTSVGQTLAELTTTLDGVGLLGGVSASPLDQDAIQTLTVCYLSAPQAAGAVRVALSLDCDGAVGATLGAWGTARMSLIEVPA